MEKRFLLLAKTALVLVYLVIAAGAMVRMTGSGMGCPDWPKCFGYYIPPTDISQLTWAPHREFESGQVIIKDEKLLVARGNFTTGDMFEAASWRPYTKHDYAIFNPAHTWVEYVNRLLGALAGFAVLAMAVASFRYRRSKTRLIWLAWLTVVLMGVQAWLGARVVYSVLNPLKITLHMIVALVIVVALLYIIRFADAAPGVKKDRAFQSVLWLAMFLTLIQIMLGTQVREFVDVRLHLMGEGRMGLILNHPDIVFYIHRSFSIAVLLTAVYLFWRNRRGPRSAKINWIAGLILAEILVGVIIYNYGFPFGTQAIHLILATLIFGLQADLIIENATRKSL